MQLNKKKIIAFAIFCVLLVGYFIFYKYTKIAIQCPIHYITGFYCPGCGITRMLFSIIKLDFYQAFRFNPLVFILLVLYIIYFILKYLIKINIKIPDKALYGLIVLLIVYGILRNIPMFSYLKPTIIH